MPNEYPPELVNVCRQQLAALTQNLLKLQGAQPSSDSDNYDLELSVDDLQMLDDSLKQLQTRSLKCWDETHVFGSSPLQAAINAIDNACCEVNAAKALNCWPERDMTDVEGLLVNARQDLAAMAVESMAIPKRQRRHRKNGKQTLLGMPVVEVEGMLDDITIPETLFTDNKPRIVPDGVSVHRCSQPDKIINNDGSATLQESSYVEPPVTNGVRFYVHSDTTRKWCVVRLPNEVTFNVAPDSEPCVDQGRWQRHADTFVTSGAWLQVDERLALERIGWSDWNDAALLPRQTFFDAASTFEAATKRTRREPPPVGLMPKWLWMEHRVKDIQAAIDRYNAAKTQIPLEWYSELSWIQSELENRAQNTGPAEVLISVVCHDFGIMSHEGQITTKTRLIAAIKALDKHGLLNEAGRTLAEHQFNI